MTAMSWLSSLTDVAKNAEALLNSVDAKAKEVAVVTNQAGVYKPGGPGRERDPQVGR